MLYYQHCHTTSYRLLPMSREDDIQALRERVSDTQTLYREVCALLFFRYGETPTANKLYQLVRKGSMSAPASALRDFWADLRDKSRVDLGRPDLPSEVSAAAGEMAATLWRVATDTASGQFEAARQDAQIEVAAALAATNQAKGREAEACSRLSVAELDAAVRLKHIAQIESRLVEEQTANSLLREQLAGSRDEIAVASAALTDARREFSAELEKLRESLRQNEQRLIGAEKRALLEIENERTAAQRARREAQTLAECLSESERAHRTERDALRDSLAHAKTEVAVLEQRRADLEGQLVSRDADLLEQATLIESLREEVGKLTRAAIAEGKSTSPRRPAPHQARAQRRELRLSADIFARRKSTSA
jgi:hypothetical protein